jgi:RNA polymerase sigma factor (sigma-70 family)
VSRNGYSRGIATAVLDPSAAVEPQLFEDLYRTHARAVYRLSLHMLGNASEAEDSTQDTFLNAYRALSRGCRPTDPRAWLFAIARNACKARWRSKTHRPIEVELDTELELEATSAESTSASELKAALERLCPNQRDVLVLRELDDLSFTDIAERLSLSESAVHALFFRARRTLREELTQTDSPLACHQVEQLLAQPSGQRSRLENDQLRAHLRACVDCSTTAHRLRAKRRLGLLTWPTLLEKILGWLSTTRPALTPGVASILGAAALGTGIALDNHPAAPTRHTHSHTAQLQPVSPTPLGEPLIRWRPASTIPITRTTPLLSPETRQPQHPPTVAPPRTPSTPDQPRPTARPQSTDRPASPQQTEPGSTPTPPPTQHTTQPPDLVIPNAMLPGLLTPPPLPPVDQQPSVPSPQLPLTDSPAINQQTADTTLASALPTPPTAAALP